MFDRLIIEKQKLIDVNQKLETEKEELIRSNYRLARNLTTLLQQNSELNEQIICEFSLQAEELDINEDINSEDIKNINQLLQEFNSTKIQPLK